ncbi:MAG: tetratricopeptide repeat protein [Ignavibacteria bacterium]|nr:tetratricopeptide repeat protein [Ignavibacteria bacterium]
MIDLQLNTDIKSLPSDEAHRKIDGINQIAEHFFSIKNYEECKCCTGKAMEFAEAINYLKGIGEAKYSFGKISFISEDYFVCIQNLIEAEKIFESLKDLSNCAKVSYQLGLAYWNIGDYQNESESFFKALDLYRQIKSVKDEANCLNSIGNYFVETGDFESSLEYHKMSLNIKRKIKDVRGIIYSLYNIALIHNNIAAFALIDNEELALQHYKISLKYYTAALEFNQKIEKDTFLEKRILQNIALNYSNCGEPEKASEMLLDCVDYFTKTNNDMDKCDTLIYLGIIHGKMVNWKKAEEYFFDALKIAERLHSSRHSINLYRSLAQMYLTLKDYKSALFYERKRFMLDIERMKTLTDNNIRKLNVLHKVDIEKKNTEVLSEKNEELQKINNKLLRLNKEKNYFLNLAAIDLKQPLEKISEFTNFIRKNNMDNSVEPLKSILKESSHMEKIISELLTINETGSLNN